ncbi:MAG TPA: hypothetical protein VKB59_08155 [Micromonosporaceae bacterium]|nr:hypothetical protein [Micromonosporaceae bacterium]
MDEVGQPGVGHPGTNDASYHAGRRSADADGAPDDVPPGNWYGQAMSRAETAHPRTVAPDRSEWDDTTRSWPPGWRHPSDPHGFPPVPAYEDEAAGPQPGDEYGFDPFADDERLPMSDAHPSLGSDPMAWRPPEAGHPHSALAAVRARGSVPLTDALTAETIEAPLFAAAAARPYGEPVAGAVRLPQVFVPRPRTGGVSVSDPLHPDWRGDDRDAGAPLAEQQRDAFLARPEFPRSVPRESDRAPSDDTAASPADLAGSVEVPPGSIDVRGDGAARRAVPSPDPDGTDSGELRLPTTQESAPDEGSSWPTSRGEHRRRVSWLRGGGALRSGRLGSRPMSMFTPAQPPPDVEPEMLASDPPDVGDDTRPTVAIRPVWSPDTDLDSARGVDAPDVDTHREVGARPYVKALAKEPVEPAWWPSSATEAESDSSFDEPTEGPLATEPSWLERGDFAATRATPDASDAVDEAERTPDPRAPGDASGEVSDDMIGDVHQVTLPDQPTLPHRVPAEPDVPFDPAELDEDLDEIADQPSGDVGRSELSRIASGLREEPHGTPELPEELDVAAVLAAVRQVPGVRQAQLRPNPGGVHILRLDLADDADAGLVSRLVARLLKERMGLAAEPRRSRTQAKPSDSSGARVRPVSSGSTATAGGARIGGGASGSGRSGMVSATGPFPPSGVESLSATGYAMSDPALLPGFRSAVAGRSGGGPVESGGYLPGAASLGDPVPLDPVPGQPPRIVIDQVHVSTLGTEATIEVRLQCDGETTVGRATGPAVDAYLLRLAAQAAASAIDSLLVSTCLNADQPADSAPMRCFIEHAGVVPFGTCIVAVVVVLVSGDGRIEQLVGSALVSGDPRQSIVRATLAAVNRRLEGLLA